MCRIGASVTVMVAVCVLLATAQCAAEEQAQQWQARAQWALAAALSVAPRAAPANDSGFMLHARLRSDTRGAGAGPRLLRLQLLSPQLHVKGVKQNADWFPRASVWDSYEGRPFYGLWEEGVITRAWLHTDQLPDFTNYERSLLSLFQFHVGDESEFENETDVSGRCSGFYEKLSPQDYRKIKRECWWEGAGEGEGEGVTSRRLTRVSFSGAGPHADVFAAASIVCEQEAGAGGLRVRSWQRLTREGGEGAGAGERGAAVGSLAPPPAPGLAEGELQAAPAPQPEDKGTQDLVEAVRKELAALRRGEGEGEGEEEEGAQLARAALRLLPALHAAPRAALAALLQRATTWELREQEAVYRWLALAAGAEAWRAARAALRLGAAPAGDAAPHALATLYLDALAHAHPTEAVAREVLELAERARCPAVRAAALHAAAAAARASPPGAALRDAVEARLRAQLAECGADSACARSTVVAMGAAACCAPELAAAVGGEGGGGAVLGTSPRLAAARALLQLPVRLLTAPVLRRLEVTALALDAPTLLEVRAGALEAWLSALARQSALAGARSLPADVTLVLAALRAHGPAELRRLAWRVLHALAQHYEPARDHLRLLRRYQPALHNYYQPGMSEALEVEAWAVGGVGVRVRSVAAVRRSLLRHARVDVALHAAGAGEGEGAELELCSLALRTAGLQALAAEQGEREEMAESDAGGGGGEEEVAGWVAWGAGAARGEAALFEGQGALAAAVWSGAGAEPTLLARALLRPRARAAAALPTALGLVAHLTADELLDVAPHAHAQVSLWSRTGAAGGGAAAAGASAASLAVHSAWGSARAASHEAAWGALRVAAAVDFYDAVSMCVRADVTPLRLRRAVTVQGEWGARAWRGSRRHVWAARRPARALALGADANAQCRALHHKHADDEGGAAAGGDHNLRRVERLAL